MAARLLIELDGSGHSNRENKLRDDARMRRLNEEGFRVIRIWNNEILQYIDSVMNKIYVEIYGVEASVLRHLRHKRSRMPLTPPRRVLRADPPSPGEDD